MLIRGSCHCGNIAFEVDWRGDPPPEIVGRACGCSFCVKHGGVWTSNRDATLRVTVKDPRFVSQYLFGTDTAQFHVCIRCGIVPLVTSEIEGRLYAVVSVNAFNEPDPGAIRRSAISFDGEEIGSRLARRARNWIGDVRYVEPA